MTNQGPFTETHMVDAEQLRSVISKPPSGQGVGYLALIESATGTQLKWVSPDELLIVVRRSTGDRGRIMRAFSNKFSSNNQYGKIAVEFNLCIYDTTQNKLYHSWDPDDWRYEATGSACP
ncbi:MAG: hypothetical protein WD534_01535 [Phycisphaeraceae bacterium]